MKSAFLVISLSLLILFVCFEERKTYQYKYYGGWKEFNYNTAENLARGVNNGYPLGLNYAYADLIYTNVGIYANFSENTCKNNFCKNFDTICNNATYFVDTNNVQTCVFHYNTTAYWTIFNDKTIYYTFDQCTQLCDSTPKCNLIEFLKPLQAAYQNQSQCNLFHLSENAIVTDVIQINTSCGDNCADAWYVRSNVCKSINAAVPDSYCQTYCLYNDATNPNTCTGVQPFMTSICECNGVVNSYYCHSLSASVPDAYCKSYCHINGATCTVDAHMSSICSCSL